MSFCNQDLSESLNLVGIRPGHVRNVLWAWGHADEGECCGGDYSCKFFMLLNDGRYALVEGGCDYTGWGCQDGAEVTYHTIELPPVKDADTFPIDLNRWLENHEPIDSV
jgi:hypothetical protein